MTMFFDLLLFVDKDGKLVETETGLMGVTFIIRVRAIFPLLNISPLFF